MSVFSSLDKKARRAVFSGRDFAGDLMPSGDILPDGSILCRTKEGWNTFIMVSCPAGKSPYGSRAVWRCDLSKRDSQRLADRAIALAEVVIA